jgi:hypothetical protein
MQGGVTLALVTGAVLSGLGEHVYHEMQQMAVKVALTLHTQSAHGPLQVTNERAQAGDSIRFVHRAALWR